VTVEIVHCSGQGCVKIDAEFKT